MNFIESTYRDYKMKKTIPFKYQQEKWKTIIGYNNLYQISNYGRIKSLKGIGSGSGNSKRERKRYVKN